MSILIIPINNRACFNQSWLEDVNRAYSSWKFTQKGYSNFFVVDLSFLTLDYFVSYNIIYRKSVDYSHILVIWLNSLKMETTYWLTDYQIFVVSWLELFIFVISMQLAGINKEICLYKPVYSWFLKICKVSTCLQQERLTCNSH